MVQDLGSVVSVITNTIPFAVITVIQLVASFCLLYSMDHTLAIVLVLILPFFYLMTGPKCRSKLTAKMPRLTLF